jgi:hypothetical protein
MNPLACASSLYSACLSDRKRLWGIATVFSYGLGCSAAGAFCTDPEAYNGRKR